MSLLFLAMMFVSCSTTKRLKENELLLVKNEIKITNPHKNLNGSDLQSLVQQKPNKRFLGIVPFGLWWNNIFKNSGAQPVALDRSLIKESEKQIIRYLNNLGFYNSTIKTEVITKKKKANKVIYFVTLSKPYTIKSYSHSITDNALRILIDSTASKSLVQPKFLFNSFDLDRERDRISKLLNDNGYFGFAKEYIFFEADSALLTRQVNLKLNIRSPNFNSPEIMGSNINNHPVYFIINITINPDFKPFYTDTIPHDTLIKITQKKNPFLGNEVIFTYHPPLKIKPRLITRSLFVKKGDKYNATDAIQSYKKLNELRVYKYVDINFIPTDTAKTFENQRNLLDCQINLTRNPVHSYSVEAQGTNSGGDLGIGGYLVYANKNLLRGGEVFNLRLKGAMEAQRSTSVPDINQSKFLFFNTFEAGIEASLYIPRFLAPINEDLFSKYFRPKTTINLGYNLQDRLDYDRIITNASFGYEWSQSIQVNHVFFPIDINLVKVNTTPSFDSIIANESARFRNQYTDHLILGLKYSYIFSNQQINRQSNFMYYRGNIESSGNLLDLAVSVTGSEENAEGFQTIFGIRYSQYVKTDHDFRYYIPIDRKNSLAFRSFIGLAIPYGNSIDMPFEKGFYGGGANGLRAWPLRYLGPGAFSLDVNKSNLERVGDIQIEGNFEYRFPIFNVLNGALFYDIGNIWLLTENETYPGGKFDFKNFAGQLAMDVGLGVRLDFSYFIFRIDFAQRLKDPSLPEHDRWVIGNESRWFNPVVNLGIGYPF